VESTTWINDNRPRGDEECYQENASVGGTGLTTIKAVPSLEHEDQNGDTHAYLGSSINLTVPWRVGSEPKEWVRLGDDLVNAGM